MPSKQNVVFVGSNPSTSSPDTSPFHPGTHSRRVVDEWIHQTGMDIEPIFLNVSDIPTLHNKPLKVEEEHLSTLLIKLGRYPHAAVVSLGNTADEALTHCFTHHLALPHPSGRNHILNDADKVKRLITSLRNWILVYKEDDDG